MTHGNRVGGSPSEVEFYFIYINLKVKKFQRRVVKKKVKTNYSRALTHTCMEIMGDSLVGGNG